MKLLPLEQAKKRRTFLRLNIVLGVFVFLIAFYMIATGDFSSYKDSKAEVALYNRIAIGGLLYSSVFWMFCVMSKPFWFPSLKNAKNQ